MESKYLVGYIYGRPAVMWDKVQDFEETASEDGEVTLKFKEDGVEYEYHGTPDRGYREIHHRAPDFQDYKYMGRRTALRHDFLDDRKRIDAKDVNRGSNRSHEIDDDDDFEEVTIDGDDGRSSCGGGYFRRTSRCGGEEIYRRGVCGGYTRVYGDGPCGAVMGNICGRSYGCGGGGHC